MATSKPQCDPCSDRGIRNYATSICTDCEEPLCSSCTDVHLSMKMSKNHHLIDVDVSSNLSSFIDSNCEKHPNMPMDFFCTRHDSLCCRSCLASNHKSCDNVLPVELAANNVKRSALFDSISDDLCKIDEALNSFHEEKSSHRTKLSQSKTLIKKEIANFKRKLFQKIDDFEAKMISDVDTIYQDLERQSNDDMQLLNDKVHITNGLKSQLSTLTKHGSDIQIFVFLHTAKLKIPEAVDCVNDYIRKQKIQDVKFTEEGTWLAQKSLGNVAVVHDNKMKDFTPIKLKSAQTSTTNESPIELVLESKINHPVLKDSLMSGIGVTREDDVANKLVRVNQDGSLKDVLLEGNIWKEPQALEFNTDFTKLYVSDETLKEIFVFSCRY